MADLRDLESTRRTLRRLMHVAEETRKSMGQAAQPMPHRDPDAKSTEVLSDAMTFVAQAREGFIITLRTPAMTTSELRALIERVMVDWNWLESLGLTRQVEQEIIPAEEPLIAYHHSLLALGVLPRLPPEAVTYPGLRRTYSDIPVPSTPHETLDRLEEMERALSEVEASGGEVVKRKEAIRHTYGFFEATHWLMVNSLRHLL